MYSNRSYALYVLMTSLKTTRLLVGYKNCFIRNLTTILLCAAVVYERHLKVYAIQTSRLFRVREKFVTGKEGTLDCIPKISVAAYKQLK